MKRTDPTGQRPGKNSVKRDASAGALPAGYGQESRERLAGVFRKLAEWFPENKRKLPWRENRDPYRIWISEIMLQQTRTETVIPYYHRFLARFPDVSALADAPEDELMKLWEGLGYYSRARNLQKAAAICRESHGNELPRAYDALLSLPGIGAYTAGAVSSIANGEKKAAVDGNVLRVISRILASRRDISDPDTKKDFKMLIEEIMVSDAASMDPGTLNQALMELGACICTPGKAPLCAECPVSGECLSNAMHLTGSIPCKAPARRRKTEIRTVFIVTDGSDIVLGKRPDKGLLAGLYELPSREGLPDEDTVKSLWGGILGCPVSVLPAGTGKHIFTHITWEMSGLLIQPSRPLGLCREGLLQNGFLAVPSDDVRKLYPVPSAFSAWKKYWESA